MAKTTAGALTLIAPASAIVNGNLAALADDLNYVGVVPAAGGDRNARSGPGGSLAVAGTTDVFGSFDVGGDLDAEGDVVAAGSCTVSGTAALAGALADIGSTASFNADVMFDGPADQQLIASSLIVAGATDKPTAGDLRFEIPSSAEFLGPVGEIAVGRAERQT